MSRKVPADKVEYYTRLALERGGRVTGHGPVEPPPLQPVDDAAEEKDFQAEIIKVAKRNCWEHYHTYDSRKSVAGWPDLVLVRERVLYREVKTEAGIVSPAQQNWLDALAAAGQDAGVWRPSDWPSILATLEAPHATKPTDSHDRSGPVPPVRPRVRAVRGGEGVQLDAPHGGRAEAVRRRGGRSETGRRGE